MRVIVACEYSGRVREAFRKLGHDAWSCDILESDDDSKFHIQTCIEDVINDGWDLMIAHPPCTHLAVSGASRGDYPIGVSLYKSTGKYQAYCSNPFTEKREHLGYFSTPKEAHEVWRKRKHEIAQLVAATESDPRIVEALKKALFIRGVV